MPANSMSDTLIKPIGPAIPVGKINGKLLAAAILLLPIMIMLVTSLMYFNNWMTPMGRVNNGILLSPVLPVESLVQSNSETIAIDQWQLILRVTGDCDIQCEYWVSNLRQLHVALGKFESRVSRLYLTDSFVPEKVSEVGFYRTLVTPLVSLEQLIDRDALGNSAIFIADPLGNTMLYYDQNTAPKEIIQDLKKMLKLSMIG